tara:strand:+ start:15676 stop:16218 length:543 start_codon:yes stop_codon:yes gene_type:complete
MKRIIIVFIFLFFITGVSLSQEKYVRVSDSLNRFSIELNEDWEKCKKKISRGYLSWLACSYLSADRKRYLFLGIGSDTTNFGGDAETKIIVDSTMKKWKYDVYNKKFDTLYGYKIYSFKIRGDWTYEKYEHLKMKQITDKLYIKKEGTKGHINFNLTSYIPNNKKDSLLLHQLLRSLIIN